MIMKLRKSLFVFAAFLLLFSLLPFKADISPVVSAEEHDVELWNTVKPLETTVSFVNIGAHPDDERSDLLAYLSRGVGVETVSLIANRGEGGQNQIGTELFTPLGIIRSMEMQEAAKVNGVDAFHLSETIEDDIYDFGFSKSKEETLAEWGEDVTYERLIRFIRTFRPDVMMPTFRDVPSQHGHHRTMSYLGIKAYTDAADPNVYPHHMDEGLKPWQARKAYLPAESEDSSDFSVEIGDYDEIYGMTYPQLGEESRYLHKSQGMGNDIPAEPRQTHFEIVGEELLLEDNHDNPILNGIPTNFEDWAELIDHDELAEAYETLHEQLMATIESYPSSADVYEDSAIALETVRQLQDETEAAPLDEDLQDDLLHKLSVKEEQLQLANYTAAKLDITLDIDSPVLVQGQNATVSVDITNNGSEDIEDLSLALDLPSNWDYSGDHAAGSVAAGESETVTFDITVSDDADYFDPYQDPDLRLNASYLANGQTINEVIDTEDTVAVLPEISVRSIPEELVINTEDVQDEVTVTLRAKNYVNGPADTTISLDIPDDWDIEPSEQAVSFSEKDEEQDISFTVYPPEDIDEGTFHLDAIANYNGKELDSTIQEIYYDHIGHSFYQYTSQVKGIAFKLNIIDDLKIGYIESGFDEVYDYLKNVGFDITKLEEEDLSSGDLSEYDTIVTGIRAYLAREDLVANNDRLLEYVENGGHMVVQHNLPAEMDEADPFPYPLKVGRPSIEWRVTDENADVTLLNPDSPLFHYPNEIDDSDWDNWIQERGLYFPMEWDDNYEALVSMADPDEDPMEGSLLFTEYGEGSYVYTSLGFYRQIQNRVAGGYRIFTNLMSYSKFTDDDESEDLKVEEVESFDDMTVPLNTALEDLTLPAKAKVTLSDDSERELDIHWDQGEPEYDGTQEGSYTFTGELVLDDDISEDESVLVTLTVHVKEDKEDPDKTVTITEVESLDPIEVELGTKLNDINLPEKVSVKLSNGKTTELAVIWDDGNPSYDANQADTYKFTGTLQLDNNIENNEELAAFIDVIVKDDESDDKTNGTTPGPGTDNGTNDSSTDDGKQLPKTATHMYTALAIGTIILLLGLVTYFIRRRQA